MTQTTTDAVPGAQPLDGLLVLDLGQMYNGSYCGMLMALHGARVIKIEPPAGEALRMRAGSPGARLPLYLVNSGKKALSLDLRSGPGREIFLQLVRKADVLIENFAPGTMDRLGLGSEVLRKENPRLVYAASTGYGAGGEFARYPAMDLTIQAMTGTMATTGTVESGPLKTGPAGADFLCGVHLLSAILMALLQRGVTGRGQTLEVAMADAVIPSLASSIAFYLGMGKEPPRTGNRHSGLAYAPYNVYAASDGHIAIFCVRNEHWAALCDVMEQPLLATDERFSSIASRVQNMDAVDAAVAGWVRGFTRAEAFERLMVRQVPSAPVLSVSEVMHEPHFRQRGAVVPIEHPVMGPLLVLGSPLHLGEAAPLAPSPAPELGQHNREILSQLLGLSDDEIDALQDAGVLGPREPATSAVN
ncbi:MAG: CoA transferase [Burkholderiaceae bacterium]|nr:CoA transferase [Burkholderiaceae bacterium]